MKNALERLVRKFRKISQNYFRCLIRRISVAFSIEIELNKQNRCKYKTDKVIALVTAFPNKQTAK